jgi:hypothetical protein
MRYHRELGFPKTIILPQNPLYLIYSKHATVRYGENALNFNLKKIKIKLEDIIEIRTKDNIKCSSLLVRKKLDSNRDIILSLKISIKKAVVITLWVNNKKDNHKTLNKNLYDIA